MVLTNLESRSNLFRTLSSNMCTAYMIYSLSLGLQFIVFNNNLHCNSKVEDLYSYSTLKTDTPLCIYWFLRCTIIFVSCPFNFVLSTYVFFMHLLSNECHKCVWTAYLDYNMNKLILIEFDFFISRRIRKNTRKVTER